MMITVDEAIAAVLEGAAPLASERVGLSVLVDRILAEDVSAEITQPPFAASAMDGYAIRFEDAKAGASLKVIGEAPAGAPFAGRVGAGEAVRVFTGGVIPDGADHVVIQEDVTRDGERITINESQDSPRHIRAAGIDFCKGDILAKRGAQLHEIHGSIFAAANVKHVSVHRRPHVAVFSNGDELREPGAALKSGQIINSNHYALCEMIRRWGGEVEYLGCAADSEDGIREVFRRGRDADIVVPIGGASVGDYDFVKSAFAKEGGMTRFEKVAVRPGKPTWCGSMGATRVVGLPGNPASAIVTAALFVQPLVRRLAGEKWTVPFGKAQLTAPLAANGGREAYLRGEVGNGKAAPARDQDSSLLLPFASANALIRCVSNAPALNIGDEVEFVLLR
ncbi:molybdopterin molybdotransferase MoeA [Hyphococcus sp.]|uniref:molybdopterin molybdotransferase MoeA n=1 Tax=Hyphococcus sp. TaxID=2038636 RepID=UPI0020806F45|nr:MAG: molybdopterin molybdenumtransferase MoeA [Marinicaulis sp.]